MEGVNPHDVFLSMDAALEVEGITKGITIITKIIAIIVMPKIALKKPNHIKKE